MEAGRRRRARGWRRPSRMCSSWRRVKCSFGRERHRGRRRRHHHHRRCRLLPPRCPLAPMTHWAVARQELGGRREPSLLLRVSGA